MRRQSDTGHEFERYRKRSRRRNEEFRQTEQAQDTRRRQETRVDVERRLREQEENTRRRQEAREDVERRLREQEENTRRRQEAREDVDRRQIEQDEDTHRRQEARSDVERRQHEQVDNTRQHQEARETKSASYLQALSLFQARNKEGPTNVCLSCGGLFFQKSVDIRSKETVITAGCTDEFLQQVVVLSPKEDGKYMLCSTCYENIRVLKVIYILIMIK